MPTDRKAALAKWVHWLDEGPEPTEQDLGMFGRELADVHLRDAVLISVLSRNPAEPYRLLDLPDGEPFCLEPWSGLVSDRVDDAIWLLEQASEWAPSGMRCHAMALVAAIAYADGDLDAARIFITRSLQDDPNYRLAHLLNRLIFFGIPARDAFSKTH